MRKIVTNLIFIFITIPVLADELNQAWEYFLREKYHFSERIVDVCLKEGTTSPEIYYLKALLLLKTAQLEEARRYFGKLSFYGGKWSGYALVGEADSFFLNGEFERAESVYSNFLKRYPGSDFVPEIIYKYALCLSKQGAWQEAKYSLQNLIKNYPQSFSASFARKILQEDEFYFTIQVGSFLNYDNAYNLAQKISNLGYPTYIKKAEYKGNIYYRVRVGEYQNRSEVEAVFKELLNKGFNGIIYP